MAKDLTGSLEMCWYAYSCHSQVSPIMTVSIFLKVTRSPCKLPTDVQKVWPFIHLADIALTKSLRLKQCSSLSLMTISMSLYSQSKAPEVLQVCWALVKGGY